MRLETTIHQAAAYILDHVSHRPNIGMVLGISCITNMAAGVLPVKLSHAEVMETAAIVHDKFHKLLNIVLTVL